MELNFDETGNLWENYSEKIVNDMCKRVIQLDNGVIVRDEEKGVYNLGV